VQRFSGTIRAGHCLTRKRRETDMADDKTKTGREDRSRVAANQDYETRDFADKFDISPAQAKRLIERHGNDRGMLEREAKKLKK
jgi:hypothetical protein